MGLFQSSFMRISFCKDWGKREEPGRIRRFSSFNPLLWGFLFARTMGIQINVDGNPLPFLFQSSFMRISFCKFLRARWILSHIPLGIPLTSKPFNPLLWGFLFARMLLNLFGKEYNGFSNFQSSFMRISFCKCCCLWAWRRSLHPLEPSFQSSFMRISFCKLSETLLGK